MGTKRRLGLSLKISARPTTDAPDRKAMKMSTKNKVAKPDSNAESAHIAKNKDKTRRSSMSGSEDKHNTRTENDEPDNGYADVVARMKRQVADIESKPDNAKTLMLPIIRHSGMVTNQQLKGELGSNMVTRPFTDHLSAVLAYDLPEAVVPLKASTLQNWGISEEAAFETAILNAHTQLLGSPTVIRRVPIEQFAKEQGLTVDRVLDLTVSRSLRDNIDVKSGEYFIQEAERESGFYKLEEYPHVYRAIGQGEALAPRVFVDGLIRDIPVVGDPVVMIPYPDLMLVTGSEDPDGLLEMAAIADQIRLNPHHISNIPIILTNQGWKTYLPPVGHPAYSQYQRLRCAETALVYGCQGVILTSRVPEFVAQCMLLKLAEGSYATFCSWAKNKVSLLPRTDAVMFAACSPDVTSVQILTPPVPWDVVQSIVGNRLEPTSYTPARYRTIGFPTDEELAAIRDAAANNGQAKSQVN